MGGLKTCTTYIRIRKFPCNVQLCSASSVDMAVTEVLLRFVVLPSSTYSLTVVHLITLKHTPQSVGLLWMRDRPVAETSN
jgi:hypothetical protein